MPFCITHSRFNIPRESIQVAKPSWNPQVPVAKGQGVIFCVCVSVSTVDPQYLTRGSSEYTVPKDHREPEFLKSHLTLSSYCFIHAFPSGNEFKYKVFQNLWDGELITLAI